MDGVHTWINTVILRYDKDSLMNADVNPGWSDGDDR